MKGLSTILAMILIVIIVVALIGLTYTFAANLFQTTTSTATTSVETTTANMDKHVSIRGTVLCKNTSLTLTAWRVNVTLRHDGATNPINVARDNELTALVDSYTPSGYDSPDPMNTYDFPVQTTKSFSFTFNSPVWTLGSSHILYIETPAGEISESITCTWS